MSSSSRRIRTNMVPWRKACAAFPAFALIGSGLVLATQAAPAPGIKSDAISRSSAAIVVPDIALTLPVPAQDPADPLPVDALASAELTASGLKAAARKAATLKAPASVLPPGPAPGSATPVILDSSGIPVHALEGYRAAATLVNAADPGCHIDWALLAAIGRVESNHARFGGNQLDSAGVAQPGIIGIPLTGANGTAQILDSDDGRLDRDPVYDRAVGPMQFIPTTWAVVGTDADGDGFKNPQDMTDAATASAIYLCSGTGDLSQPPDLSAAILRYNHSDPYVQMVTAIADTYRLGVNAIPASDIAAASLAPSTPLVVKPAIAKRVVKPAIAKRVVKPAIAKRVVKPKPAIAIAQPVAKPAVPAAEVPAAAIPAPVVPAAEVPAPVVPAAEVPAPVVPAPETTPPPTDTPNPCVPIPDRTITEANSAEPNAEPAPCLPPCAPVPAPTTTEPSPTEDKPSEPVACQPVPCVPVPDPNKPEPAPAVTDPSTPGPVGPCPTPSAGTSPSTPTPTTPTAPPASDAPAAVKPSA